MKKFFLSMLLMLLTTASAVAQEAYAVFTKDGTLTFYYDNQKGSRDGTKYEMNRYFDEPGWYTDHRKDIKKAVFDSSFTDARPTSTCRWFAVGSKEKSILSEIVDIGYLNTCDVVYMSNMFANCSNLAGIDLSHFDTNAVMSMDAMFFGCSSLTTLELSNFNTTNVTNMASMFASCNSLNTLDLSNFDTSNVRDMTSMFSNCRNLTTLNLSNFDTSKVTSMYSMFFFCESLISLEISNFNTSKVEQMESMFYGCSSLTSLDLSNFDTSNVDYMANMFRYCRSLTTVDLSNFDTKKVRSMVDMFSGCVSLTVLDLSNFDTRSVTSLSDMFMDCNALHTIYCGDSWNTKYVTSSLDMFHNCYSIVGGAGTVYDRNHEDASYAHVDGGPSNPGYLTHIKDKDKAKSIANSDDLQAFIDGLSGNGDKGTAEEPKVIPVSDEGLTIDKEVNIEDDLQLLIDGQTDKPTVIYFPNISALNINNSESSWQFNNSTLTSSAVASAKIMGVASNDSWGGINNQGKLTFAASIFENGNYVVKNLPSGILTLKNGTAVNGQQNIVNSGTLYTDGTCAINGIGNKQSGRIHLTAQPTQSVSIMITETSDVEEGQPIVSGSDGYTLTEADAASITLTVPDGYECNYDAVQNALVVTSTNGITTLGTKAETVETNDLTGRKTTSTKKGLSIQRMSNGSVKKVIVK